MPPARRPRSTPQPPWPAAVNNPPKAGFCFAESSRARLGLAGSPSVEHGSTLPLAAPLSSPHDVCYPSAPDPAVAGDPDQPDRRRRSGRTTRVGGQELVENAIDAGASRVDIDLEEGGVRLIRIRDNGSGIAPEQLPLAVSRHATSKIADLDDLESVATLGFREKRCRRSHRSAASPCARGAHDEHGSALQIEGGKIGEVTPRAHAPGTTVEVRELFTTCRRGASSCAPSVPNWAISKSGCVRWRWHGRMSSCACRTTAGLAALQARRSVFRCTPCRNAGRGFRQPGRARGPQRRRPAPAWLDCAAALFARERRPAVPVRQRSLSA